MFVEKNCKYIICNLLTKLKYYNTTVNNANKINIYKKKYKRRQRNHALSVLYTSIPNNKES
jgi:hypothetical protein